MTLYRHELRTNRTSLFIWCGVLAGMTMLTMLLYPSFKAQMGTISSIFAMMGPFSAALGLDQLDMSSAAGFYGIESGTMLAVGGTMFAAFTGIGMLAKEEGGHTAEFLLTLPIGRGRVVLEKLLALLTLLALFNLLSMGVGAVCFLLIGEPLPFGAFALFHGLQLLLQVEIGCVCMACSAFFRRTQVGLGLGIALLLYFLSLVANMVRSARFLRYLTPFAYADASRIFTRGTAELPLVTLGLAVIAASVGIMLMQYRRKDIAA